jgi:hypothetical protein
MIYRAKQNRLIPHGLYRQLWKDFARLGWRTDEPGYVAPDRPIRMEVIFDAAVRQHKMSLSDVARIAGVDERLVRMRLVRAVGASTDDFDSPRDSQAYSLETYRREVFEMLGDRQ